MTSLHATVEQYSPECVGTHGSSRLTGRRRARWNLPSIVGLATVLVLSTILMLIYHDRFWAPADEGNYAHVAERILSGQVLHRDVQDVHAGYINFVNAAAMWIFGVKMVSMRYPLALLTVLQAGLVFLLLRPRGHLPAAIGALALTSLGFVQFLNPTANWYSLFFTVCAIAWLSWSRPGLPGRHIVTGILLGTTFLFRQLSGVFLATGVIVFLLLEQHESTGGGRRDLSRALLLLFAVGLTTYLLRVTEPVGWVLLGVWPLPILFHAWHRTTMSNRELGGVLFALSLGALISALPLLTYHLAHGSVGAWLSDSFGAAASLPRMDFMKRPGYLMMAILAWRGFQSGDLAGPLNAAFWAILLLLSAVLGLLLLHALVRGSYRSGTHPLPVIAAFFTLVSLHYQLPIYLYYTVGLTLAAILWLTAQSNGLGRGVALGAAIFLAGVGLYYQAAMPISRHLQGVVAGERRFPEMRLRSPVAGIYVDSTDAATYNGLIALIDQETSPGDSIVALPTNSELYFLSQRTNPFRFYNTALGIRSSADLHSVLRLIACHPPTLVLYNPEDKYNTAASTQIASLVQQTYLRLDPKPPFQVFRRPADSSGNNEREAACLALRASDG